MAEKEAVGLSVNYHHQLSPMVTYENTACNYSSPRSAKLSTEFPATIK